MKFECHITVHAAQAVEAERVAKFYNWKTSQIARDPVLGDDTFFYLTAYDTDFATMLACMDVVAGVLNDRKIRVLRKKIEMIVYDFRA